MHKNEIKDTANNSIWNKKKKIIYALYLMLASWLPKTRHMRIAGKIRNYFARCICNNVHPTANIEKGAHFNPCVEIGEKSSIGIRCDLDGPVRIGKFVMMGPETAIYTRNHKHDSKEIPMIYQGYDEHRLVTIEDDVWIGRRVMIMPGVTIAKGCIIAAGAVVTKNTSPYSVWGGCQRRNYLTDNYLRTI